MIFHSHANKTHFHKKVCALGLVLKVKELGTWNSEVAYWFVINKWKEDDEVMNKWKSYMRTAEWRIIWRKITAVMYATFAVAKRKPEKKIQACTGFEPLTSAIPVQRSAMIFLHIILYSAVHIYDFHMPCNKFWSFMFPRHISHPFLGLLSVWLVHFIKGYFLFGGKWLLHLRCDPNSLKATKLFQ